MKFRSRVVQDSSRLTRLCLVIPEEKVASLRLGLLTGVDFLDVSSRYLPNMSALTPSAMVPASVLGLKAFRW